MAVKNEGHHSGRRDGGFEASAAAGGTRPGARRGIRLVFVLSILAWTASLVTVCINLMVGSVMSPVYVWSGVIAILLHGMVVLIGRRKLRELSEGARTNGMVRVLVGVNLLVYCLIGTALGAALIVAHFQDDGTKSGRSIYLAALAIAPAWYGYKAVLLLLNRESGFRAFGAGSVSIAGNDIHRMSG